MAKGALTVEQIARKKNRGANDLWLVDQIGERGAGRLVVRIPPQEGGVRRFYFRYAIDGKRVLIPLGTFIEKDRTADDDPRSTLTLPEARKKAEELRVLHKAPASRDVRTYQEAQRVKQEREAAAQKKRDEAAQRLQAARDTYTLRKLLDTYVTHLEAKGKHKSALDAANIFKNHVFGSQIASMAASEVTAQDVTERLRAIIADGKGRTAAKARAYMRAAYALGVASDLDASSPAGFSDFRLTGNPVSPVKALAQFSVARKRVLTVSELRAFMLAVEQLPASPQRAAISLLLLLGGQRVSQLLRLRQQDVDLDARSIVLLDPKGKRIKGPRRHELPLTEAAFKVLAPLVATARKVDCEWIFTTDAKTHLTPETISKVVAKLAKALRKGKEVTAPFQLSDLRRTCETMLAKNKIGSDVRAHLLSHGLGGVQARHYNMHGYEQEKRAALAKWTTYLARVRSGEALRDNVTEMPRRQSRG